MKKVLLSVLYLSMLVFAFSGVSYAWQGRMGGMGDPFGLVADESDYLIHPAKIANGEGVRFYLDYRFTYTGVPKWDDRFIGGLEDVSGYELGNNALIGIAFPLWLGRMGIFFTYDGTRGRYSEDDTNAGPKLKNDLDNFAVRLMYGLPVGGSFKLGAEAELAYRNEQQHVLNGIEPFFPYQYPNDSKYLEALFKGSMEGKVGPVDVELTLRGGFDLPGTNSSEWNANFGGPFGAWNAHGEVHGWQVGSDLWLRYALAPDLTLPFLVRADYLQRPRSGFGPGTSPFANPVDFQGEVRELAITIGGGVDKEISKATRIAAGIYYNFLQGKEDFTFTLFSPFGNQREDFTYPDSMEHQLLLRLVGEHALSPAVTLRAGLNLFYGWVIPELTASLTTNFGTFDIFHEDSGHGYDWGIGASLGATVKIKPLTMEPFVGGGYRQLHLGVSGSEFTSAPAVFPAADTISRNEWLVDAGLSILFDL